MQSVRPARSTVLSGALPVSSGQSRTGRSLDGSTGRLLRGINVGGHNKIGMAQLRELLGELGFARVRTHLQIYLWCPNGLCETKLSHAFREKRLGLTATGRNCSTVTKLLALADSEPDSAPR